MNTKHLLFHILLLFTASINAQQYFGGHPLGQDWGIMNSPAVRVIHPKGMTLQAERIANIINYINKNNQQSVGNKSKQFDLVLQTQTINPNGYVGLAPLRSEFFSTPPQSNLSLGSLDWLDVLSIHEYRHIQQNLNAKNGIVNWFYYLGGESYWAVLNNLVLPNWYYEGDAVITETALTDSGRGRIPYFTMPQRALIESNLEYRYTKHRNGSYKDMLPNHYPLGYMMLTYLRNHYGNNITAKIVKEATAFKGIIYPFSKAIKRNTNLKGTKDLYKKSWAAFKENSNNQLSNTNLIPTTAITEEHPKTVTTYSFPILLNDETIIARKKSYSTTDEIVKITNGNEKKITSIGINNDDFLSYNHQLLAWTETTRNARRGLQDYSDVILYDLKTNQKKRITKHTRYFSPSISPDGSKIAVIHISTLEEFNLTIINATTGEVEQVFKNPNNVFLSRTCWTPDGKNIVTIQKQHGELCVVKINIDNGKTTELTPWTKHTIESPFVANNQVYFNASYSGIDNIYKTDTNGSKQIQQVSSVPVGAFQPTILGDKMLISEFTANGYQLSEQNLSNNTSIINYQEPKYMEQYKTIANKAEGGAILNKIDSTTYNIKEYKGLFTGLKLHTWGIVPSYSVSEINLRAVNILNDLAFNIGAEINHNENNNIIYNANAVFSRFYPEITLNASKTSRQTIYENNSSSFNLLSFNETNIGLRTAVPLTWYKGNYINNFYPYAEVSQFFFNNVNVSSTPINFVGYETGFTFSSIKRTATQNIGSRSGFVFNFTKMAGIIDAENADKTNINTSIYLPGISKNHHLRIRASYQKENLTNTYKYSDYNVYPRGYSTPISDEFESLSFNYGLPLIYPDFGFGGIVYFKRIKANIFYDYGVGKLNNSNFKDEFKSIHYNSTGSEILFDNEYFNVLTISAGVRYSHLLKQDVWGNNNTNNFQFILATNLSF